MCNKTNTPRRSKRKPKPRNLSLKHSRKTRTKTRKPKYLSLVHLEENSPQSQMPLIADKNNSKESTDKQLNLFPLHPENLVEDRDTQYDHVSLLFNTTVEDNDHAVTLNGLLDSEGIDNYKNETATTTVTSEESPLSPSLTYGYYSTGENHQTRLSLVRTAMKGKKERDESEEKWVVYSEVVENREMEEVSSAGGGGDGDGSSGAWCSSNSKKKMEKLLALKLDYEEIMNAWSDKGPFYIEGESPQTVPHLHEPSVLVDGLGSASNVWKVPEMGSNLNMKEEIDGKEEWIKRGHREASVLRYKEKRQNRLFSKRIRYEVRKLNAEKRPRLKGRFVKRD